MFFSFSFFLLSSFSLLSLFPVQLCAFDLLSFLILSFLSTLVLLYGRLSFLLSFSYYSSLCFYFMHAWYGMMERKIRDQDLKSFHFCFSFLFKKKLFRRLECTAMRREEKGRLSRDEMRD